MCSPTTTIGVLLWVVEQIAPPVPVPTLPFPRPNNTRLVDVRHGKGEVHDLPRKDPASGRRRDDPPERLRVLSVRTPEGLR